MSNEKAILCYGDSNTWGYEALTAKRYARSERWPGVLATELGQGYHVIEEGLPGRTTVWDDPIDEFHSGKQYLRPCLASHKPLDLVIIMLGTNDLKARFSLNAHDIALGAGVLVQMVQRSDAGLDGAAPPVLLIAPPPITTPPADIAALFTGGVEKSSQLAAAYQQIALQAGCAYLNAGDILNVDPSDGIHLTRAGHTTLAHAVAEVVRELLA